MAKSQTKFLFLSLPFARVNVAGASHEIERGRCSGWPVAYCRFMSPKGSSKQKLIDRVVAMGLCPTHESAERQIRAGLVRVDGQVVDKPGTLTSIKASVALVPRKDFVGRGAHKLLGALDSFQISPRGLVCADVGACTGGFTEVLLLRGARKVFAIDVGYGDLDWKIRTDPKVVVMERTNARYLEALPEPVSLATIDVSFISLDQIIPSVVRWLAPGGTIVALVKPQFEARREDVGIGGIVEDANVHKRVVAQIVALLPGLGLTHRGTVPSSILGSEGNQEFLIWAELG